MSSSVGPAIPLSKRPRPSGPRKQAPRQHVASLARSTMSPAPERARLVRNSPAPVEKTGHARVCRNADCPGSDIVEDDMGGGLVCRSCGNVLNESNIVAENQWIENPGGVAGMAGQYVGSNQAAPRTTGGRRSGVYGAGSEATDTRYHSEQKARATMKALEPDGVKPALADQGIQIYKLAVQHGLLHGRTIELVAAVSAYIACRRDSKNNTVMLIDIADRLNINLFVLGSLYQKMVEKLKGIGGAFSATIEPVNPEALLTKFADHMEFGSDKMKIVRDGVHIFKRMKRDWITDGRRPAGIAAAAVLLAARMNNYHRTVREVVLHAKLTEITINKRLWEFNNTEAAQWHVEEFRKLAREEAEGSHWEGAGPMSLPPIYYMNQPNPPKRPRGRPRKHPRPVTEASAEVEASSSGEDETQSQNNGRASTDGEPALKRIRVDTDGFKVPDLPVGPRSTPTESSGDLGVIAEPHANSAFSSPQSNAEFNSDQAPEASQPIVTQDSEGSADSEDLFIVDEFEDGIMITDDSTMHTSAESNVGFLDAQQQMRVLESIEREHNRRGLHAGNIRPPLSHEEKQRRIVNNLCLYCGWPGHTHTTCGAAKGAGIFKKRIREQERQASWETDERGGIPSIRLTPFSQQSTLNGSTLQGDGLSTIGDDGHSTLGDAGSNIGDDYQSTLADDDGLRLTPKFAGTLTRSETPASSVGTPKKRGRAKGSKNKKAPDETAAELAMEGQITDDMSYALVHGAHESDRSFINPGEVSKTAASSIPRSQEAIDLTSEIGAASAALRNATPTATPNMGMTLIPPGGVPVSSSIGNTGTVTLSPTISPTEFDDDPEVAMCLLSTAEANIKERIWVAENAEWLRKDHYKRIQKELRDAALIAEGRDPEEERNKKKKGRRLGAAPYMEQVRQRRRERLSQTPAGEELTVEQEIALSAAEARHEMVNQHARTAFSRRFNQQSMDGIWGNLAGGSSSPNSASPSPQRSTEGLRIGSRKHRISSVSTENSRASLERMFQPPDEDGPLGPGMARTTQSLAASKREARRWESLRKQKDELGIPQKVSIPKVMRPGANRWGALTGSSSGRASSSPTLDTDVDVMSQQTPAPTITRRQPARPRQPPRATIGGALPTTSRQASADSGSASSINNLLPGEATGPISLSDLPAPSNSSSLAISHLEGFGPATEKDANDQDEDISSEDDDEEEDMEDEIDDDDDEVEDAFAGLTRRRYASSDESDDDEE